MFHRVVDLLGIYINWRRCKGYRPLHADLIVSSKCNSRCIMCNVWKLTSKNPEFRGNELTLQELTKLFEELSRMGTRSIALSGGEPLLRKDIMSIVKEAKRYEFQVELITNGTLMDAPLAEEIVTSSLDTISFSIDAPTPGAYEKIRGVKGWEKAIEGVKKINRAKEKLNAEKPVVNINYIVSRVTYQHIKEMINLKPKLGFERMHLLPIVMKTPQVERLLLKSNDIKNLQDELPRD
jgi:MoaA/NifB/PqqE/SkfB family radical SAM enzyme